MLETGRGIEGPSGRRVLDSATSLRPCGFDIRRLASSNRTLMTTEPLDFGGDPKLSWSWEGNVQAQVARFLVAEGWTLERVADTASRRRGIDLVATKGEPPICDRGQGLPGTVYALLGCSPA
jgi:hypothetical protein